MRRSATVIADLSSQGEANQKNTKIEGKCKHEHQIMPDLNIVVVILRR